jgi:hypothetical protein
MKRPILALMFVWLASAALDARASCTTQAMYTVVTTEYSDGTIVRHWEFDGWAEVCTGGGGGGGYYPPPSGGGTGTGTVPQAKVDQRNEYSNCPDRPLPAYSELLDHTGYTASGLGNYVPWEDFKNANADYVMVSGALATGVTDMGTCMDNQLPRLGSPGTGGGYRPPSESCGRHAYGEAVDFSVRQMDSYGNNTGPIDCQLWNAVASCATAAGGWVEPLDDMKAAGNELHVHVSFGQPPNTAANYGNACTDW